MADIQTYLDQIKNAQYGKDVRQSIHDGIKQCYEDGKAGAIDLTAREDINALNSALTKSNMDILWINQEGTYRFPLPIGKMAVIITYHGIYPHYSSSSGITANQLGGDEENENIITSVNNNQRTVSVYNKDSGATQAVILLPR